MRTTANPQAVARRTTGTHEGDPDVFVTGCPTKSTFTTREEAVARPLRAALSSCWQGVLDTSSDKALKAGYNAVSSSSTRRRPTRSSHCRRPKRGTPRTSPSRAPSTTSWSPATRWTNTAPDPRTCSRSRPPSRPTSRWFPTTDCSATFCRANSGCGTPSPDTSPAAAARTRSSSLAGPLDPPLRPAADNYETSNDKYGGDF